MSSPTSRADSKPERAGWRKQLVVLAVVCPAAMASHAQAPVDAVSEPAAASTPAPVSALEAPFQWHYDYDWTNWQGLNFYSERKTHLPGSVPYLPLLKLDQRRFGVSIGGRIEVDGAGFATDGNLTGFDSGFDLRRARITAKGAAIIDVPFRYHVDLSYVPGKFAVTQAYVVIPGVRWLGDVTFGEFTPPMGLQLITSSWDISLMEPAAPLQAIAPPSQPGVQASDSYLGSRGTWALGLYASNDRGNEYGSASSGYGNLMGRITWLAIDAMNEEDRAANRYLHVGLSANVQYASNGEVRYRSRPESYSAPYVIDTGNIDAAKASTVGAEVLWVDGPLSLQGEVIGSRVSAIAGERLHFSGFYAQASWYLTGESRPYDRSDGAPGRLIPSSAFQH